MNTEHLWVEKYRPSKISDIVAAPDFISFFQSMVDSGEVQNMILAGSAGLGKTTVAKALANELGMDTLFINGSEDSGIDVLRTKIRNFASSMSMSGGHRLIIIDEADYMNPNSTQPALRSFIEEFSSNCRFILTCNYVHRILPALQSRCTVVDFYMDKPLLAQLAERFMVERMIPILTAEGVSFDPALLAQLIVRHAPDFRKITNICQRHSKDGQLDLAALIGTNTKDEALNSLVTLFREKNFKGIRQWAADNSDKGTESLFRQIYDKLTDLLVPSSAAEIVLTLGEYSYRSAFVADKELNLVACLTEILGKAVFK